MPTFFSLLFFASIILFIIGLIRPSLFSFINKSVNRKITSAIFGALCLLSFIGVGVTAEPVTQPDVILREAVITDETTDTEEVLETALVTEIIDGDTIDATFADGSIKRLRLIGIDTPETKHPTEPVGCFGQEATAFTTNILLNQIVLLESDDSQGDLDKYNRSLRYVFLEDGTNFNKLIIYEGYAYEYTYDTPYKYQNEFKVAQSDAEINKRGLWADDACIQEDSVETEADSSESIPASEKNGNTADAEDLVGIEDASNDGVTDIQTCGCTSDIYNCSDFSAHADAQYIHDCCYAITGSDVHKLDGDGDGDVCESLN